MKWITQRGGKHHDGPQVRRHRAAVANAAVSVLSKYPKRLRIGAWTDAEIKRAIVGGVRPDGTRLTRTMPFDWYARMAPDDLDALAAYLRSLKPVK